MTDTATIWRMAATPDGAGGETVAWTADGTVACQLAVISTTERQVAATEGVEVTHTVKMPVGSGVGRGDRLVVGPVTVEVVSVDTGTHVTVDRAQAREEPWDEPTT